MRTGPRSLEKSLTNRLAVVIFLSLLLATVLVGAIVYYQATQSLTAAAFERLSAVASLKEDSLNRWIDQQRLNLVFIAWQPDVQRHASLLLSPAAEESDRQAARGELADYLAFVVTRVADANELFILDLDGRVMLSTLPGHEGQDHSADLFFQKGMSATYIQPVYDSPETGRPAITISTPLFDTGKRRVGVLAAHLNLARVDRIFLERAGLGASGATYLVDPANRFVSAAMGPAGAVRASGIDAALRGQSGQALYNDYRGEPVLGVYLWLPGPGVALLAEMSQAEAFAPARQLAITILEIGLLLALILAGAAYFLSRRIAHPILAITATANRVAAGDLSQTAPVLTDDEIGRLASTFNEMIGQLRLQYENLEKKVAERTSQINQVNLRLHAEIAERQTAQERLRGQNEYLNALHETSIDLISHLELEELFAALVSRAGQLLGTRDGFIYIAEPGAAEIECKVGLGIFQQLIGFRVPPGEGLGGIVWQSGRPLVVDDYDRWSGRVKNLATDLIRSIAGIPLTSGSQTVGVLGLAYASGADGALTFGPEQIELLQRFGQLASIALDNARLFQAAGEARAAAEAANESKSAFLANVSHELRTPLTSIIGFTRMVQKRLAERILPLVAGADPRVTRAADQVSENLRIILAEGERLTSLINDLLDLEKIGAGKMVWHMGPLQLAEVIDQAHAATSTLLEAKGLAWVREIPPDLPKIHGDRDRLEQVLINLISNAVKFTQQGAITCRVEPVAQELVVSVIDQGIGIAPEDQVLVFEKFRQVGDTLTGKPKGTGLGLSICKEIVTHHGGRMWLRSELGVGSAFFFSLPLKNTLDESGLF
jgi:signal transduction histidine kinase